MGVSDVARANADLRYGGQQSAIQRRIDALRADTAGNVAALEGYGTTGRNEIGEAYNILDQMLGANRAQSQKDLGTQVDLVGRGYREANDITNLAKDQARSYLGSMAERLGVQGALPDASSDLENSVAQIVGRNAQNDATTTGNLRTWASQNDQILGRGQALGGQMRASSLSNFETELLDALAGARLEGTKGENQLQGNLLDILNERGAFLTSESARLAQEEWERALQQAQLNQQAQQANAELGLRAAALADERSARASANQRASKSDELDWAKYGLSEKELAWKMGQQDPEDTSEKWRVAGALLSGLPSPMPGMDNTDQIISILQELDLMETERGPGGGSFGNFRAPALSAVAGLEGMRGYKPPSKSNRNPLSGDFWRGVGNNIAGRAM